MGIKNICLCCFLSCSFLLQAQEILTPLQYNYSLLNRSSSNNQVFKREVNDTLTIPFIDDFSYEGQYPSNFLWSDSNAYVNRTYGINVPTIGVVTLDGLDKNGLPYSDVLYNYGEADTLTSKIIDLSSIDTGSIYISFYYQQKGNGNQPDYEDSILLEVLNEDSTWNLVWTMNGGIISDEFIYTSIAISDSSYFHDGFRFRFVNYATNSGNNDHWNLDYIKLTDKSDTIIKDVCIKDINQTLLTPYMQVPWDHFDSSIHLKGSHSFVISNLSELEQAGSVLYFYKVFQLFPQIAYSLIDSHSNNPPVLNVPIDNNVSVEFKDDLMVDLPLIPKSPKVKVKFKITYEINKSGWLNQDNDTISFYQKFNDYYAYDDGSAETAYGLVSTGAKLAIEYNISKEDSLYGILIHWAHMNMNNEDEFFSLYVWDQINKTNASGGVDDTLFYVDFKTPVYVDSLNGWYYYPLDEPKIVSGDIYIGWVQTTSEMLNVGFDVNTNNNSKIFYNVSGNWTNTQFKGSVMMRPVFGKSSEQYIPEYPAKINEVLSSTDNIFIYPNPFNDLLTIEFVEHKKHTIKIFNLFGQKVKELKVDQKKINLTLSDLNDCIYILNVINEENIEIGNYKILKTDLIRPF